MARTTGTVPVIPGPAPADDGTPVAATDELAALEAERDEKRRRLERAARAALGGAPGLPAGCGADDVPALLRRYYWRGPAAEVLDHDPADLAALALRHLRLAEVRPQGSATVDVQELAAGDGTGSRALVLVVTDDMPFLVDSVTAEVVRQGFGIEHVVHPVLVVRRDVTGRIRAFCDSADPDVCGADALAESWMAVLLDGPLDEEAAGDLVAGLRTVLADVRAVHEDAARMRTRALELADRLGRTAVPPETAADPADDPAEAAALLRWLTDGNFVFLGARDVDLVRADGRTTARPVAGSGLGVLRGDADIATAPESAPGTTLLAAAAAAHSVREVPLVRRRVAGVVERSGVPADSHTGKELLDVLETYPRDELFQVGTDELLPVALAVLHLQERRQTRLFLRRDPGDRFWSAIVYLPRDRYTTEVRLAVQQLLLERLGGSSIEYTARVTESVLARLHFVVRPPVTRGGRPTLPEVDVPALQDALAAVVRSWTDELAEALGARYGADAERRFARVADAFPAAYQEDFPATTAVEDLERLDGLAEGELGLVLRRPAGASAAEPRLAVYRVGQRLLLSDVLPMLQHLGVDVVDERPYEIDRIGAPLAWIYDFGLTAPVGDLPFPGSLPERFTEALSAVWRGGAEDDGLGALVLLAGHPEVVARLVALFETRFSPGRDGGRAARTDELVRSLREAIGRVESLDADRVLTALLAAVLATQRTTYYAMSGPRPTLLALKLHPAEVPDVPEPRPAREVWVSSPRVMGVHLRFGAVARGGLRWSDRHEDLRTEVLGLVKAQMVKNTVIVPTGAKGGFVVRNPPPESAGRDAWVAEGQACYRLFIGALLSLTDNLVSDSAHPPKV